MRRPPRPAEDRDSKKLPQQERHKISNDLCNLVRGREGQGGKFISDYRPVWDYASKVGLPEEFVMLAFQVFKDRYLNGEKGRRKTYRDWRLAFLNAIKADWFRLWRADGGGSFCLTSAGLQAELEHRKAA